MDAENIVKMTPTVVEELLAANGVETIPKEFEGNERRAERWPFPGTVEVWLPEQCYGDRHMLATLHNLSREGLALRSRRPIDVGVKISLALHQPAISCYGAGYVRHCTPAAVGYLVGLEFDFASDA